jgi:NADP-dependent 3-hydroxy acid dehydrogenase YdfG
MAHSFQNKLIWLTGASSGIGAALAHELARQGGRLIISGRNSEALQALKQTYPNQILLILPFDITDRAATLAAAVQIQQQFGHVDIAIFNAGASQHTSPKTFEVDAYLRMIEINYYSLIYGVEAVLPLLRQSKCPQLVGMASIASYTGLPGGSPYTAAKAAARNFLQAMAVEFYPQIPVSIICPGFVATPLTAKNKFKMPLLMSSEKAARIIAKGIAKRRGEIHFPKRVSLVLKCIAALPANLKTKLLARTIPKS